MTTWLLIFHIITGDPLANDLETHMFKTQQECFAVKKRLLLQYPYASVTCQPVTQ